MARGSQAGGSRTLRAHTPALLLTLAAILLSAPRGCNAQYGKVIRSRGTFYGAEGGDLAAGTMGGACGYGNLYNTGYGVMTAAASIAMWNSGGICGACYQVRCVLNAKYCIPGASVIVTVTNQCPQGSEGGWCNRPQQHLDMAYPAWKVIANNPKAGVVETEMWRVPCPKEGGVGFMISGNPWFSYILVFNVGGTGDLSTVETSQDGGTTWASMSRNWGGMWSGKGLDTGKDISFRLTGALVPDKLTIISAAKAGWYRGGTYRTTQNFGSGGGGGGGGGDNSKTPSNNSNNNNNNNNNNSNNNNNNNNSNNNGQPKKRKGGKHPPGKGKRNGKGGHRRAHS